MGEFEGLSVGGEFFFLAGGLAAEGDHVLGIIVKREEEATATRRLDGVGDGVGEDDGELGFGAGGEEKAGGDKNRPATEGNGFGRFRTIDFGRDLRARVETLTEGLAVGSEVRMNEGQGLTADLGGEGDIHGGWLREKGRGQEEERGSGRMKGTHTVSALILAYDDNLDILLALSLQLRGQAIE